MTQIYFHCSNSESVWVDRCGATVGDLSEARERATLVMRSLISTPGAEDWRGWVLHVSDEIDEIFCLPFASLLGKPH
jgi:hypothetical protein